jgi:hypothetical protein
MSRRRVRTAQAFDDLAEMFIRLMQKRYHKAREALEDYHSQHQEQTDALVSLLSQIIGGWQNYEIAAEQLKVIGPLTSEEAGTILEQFEAHLASPARTEHTRRSFDIADMDVGKNIAAGLEINQTEADRGRLSGS